MLRVYFHNAGTFYSYHMSTDFATISNCFSWLCGDCPIFPAQRLFLLSDSIPGRSSLSSNHYELLVKVTDVPEIVQENLPHFLQTLQPKVCRLSAVLLSRETFATLWHQGIYIYKAMLIGVFSHRGIDLSQDQMLSSIVKVFSRQVCSQTPKFHHVT